jgi:hypothetical protein
MLHRIPALFVNAAFVALFFVATYPAWSIWVFGYNPSLNDC